jgi:hypothetical protein
MEDLKQIMEFLKVIAVLQVIFIFLCMLFFACFVSLTKIAWEREEKLERGEDDIEQARRKA